MKKMLRQVILLNQTPLKEHLYDNLSIILPQLKEMDDLIHEKKTLPHGQVIYYLYIKEMNKTMEIQTRQINAGRCCYY